mmetsp:Transcript_2839/g.5693  ORF Transcript_2839/g.5693 Transcript_2839/m.5693 type:complete len:91 (+) Transcript_2839:48-320(+)
MNRNIIPQTMQTIHSNTNQTSPMDLFFSYSYQLSSTNPSPSFKIIQLFQCLVSQKQRRNPCIDINMKRFPIINKNNNLIRTSQSTSNSHR